MRKNSMEPVDLLLITWNRRAYLEKTITNLLASDDNFRLYCWDNNSEDGTADIIADLDDPRVVKKHFSQSNVKQREPSLWFFNQAQSDVVGKIDDDILFPHGWIETLAPLVRSNKQFGLLSCWNYMESDWNEDLAKEKIINLDGNSFFQNTWVGGTSFLARLDNLILHIHKNTNAPGFPIDQYLMTQKGFINGYPLPLMFAHHMDDPRSEHYISNEVGSIGATGSATARRLGFESPEMYGQWIADDAKKSLRKPVREQLKQWRIDNDSSTIGRVRRKLYRYFQRKSEC